MKKVSDIIHAFLTTNPLVIAVASDRVFPLVAPEKTLFPLLTYNVQQGRGVTKESKVYDITIFCWFDNYTDAVIFHDGILPFIEEHRDFTYQDSTVDYLEEYRTYSTIINLQIIN
jgi:hypothetical protein